MTRIKLAKNAGFCMGVRRAVNMALEAAKKKNGPICTCGPLIHNPQVLRILEGRGIKSIPGDAGKGSPERSPQGTIIIRAHGLSPQERRNLKETGARILDATCPHVGKVQGIIRRYAQEGYATIIVGESDHAEVIGLMGYAQGNGYVVNRLEEVESLPPLDKVCMVAQTTQDRSLFQAFAEKIERKYPGAKIFNTLCDSTRLRQDEVSNLAKKVNAMIVVGGRESGNTRRLAQISEAAGIPTFLVESEKELNLKELSRYDMIGVTAGASTPNWLILNVAERLKSTVVRKGPLYILAELLRLAAINYLFLAFGAACLTYAAVLLQGLQPKLSWMLIAAFYVFSMHVLNRIIDRASEKYNQPGRIYFYERYRKWLIAAGISSAVIALTLAWFEGVLPFICLLAISGLGMCYNIRIFPERAGRRVRYQKLQDIPGSKTLFVALAWGVVTSFIPALAQADHLTEGAITAFFFSAILVLVRCSIYDFKDIQGDLMVGKETIPIVLGREKAEYLSVFLIIVLAGMLIGAAYLGLTTPAISYYLLISLVYVVLYYLLHRWQVLGSGFLFEGVVDGSLIFAGFLAFLGSLAQT